jgi:hypothetical protein
MYNLLETYIYSIQNSVCILTPVEIKITNHVIKKEFKYSDIWILEIVCSESIMTYYVVERKCITQDMTIHTHVHRKIPTCDLQVIIIDTVQLTGNIYIFHTEFCLHSDTG